MATVDAAGIPNASYAAYVEDAGDYYVYVSELATHTQNLQQSGTASVLFIENETEARHLFARQRVTYQCETYEVLRDSERFGRIMGLFSEKFGGFMEMLKNLQDFHLICLHPIEGAYVQGFARAFIVEGENLSQIRHMNDKGHQAMRTDSQRPAVN
jgi:putative heme iron utilization protein